MNVTLRAAPHPTAAPHDAPDSSSQLYLDQLRMPQEDTVRRHGREDTTKRGRHGRTNM